jgi:hypothetical protein
LWFWMLDMEGLFTDPKIDSDLGEKFVDTRGSFARFFMIDLSLERQVFYYAEINANVINL